MHKQRRPNSAMFYCWKNPDDVFWHSGVAIQISGESPANIPELLAPPPQVNLPGEIPIDPSITYADGAVKGRYDAERKLLNWALSVTAKEPDLGTVGIAYLAHAGKLATCPQCSTAIQYFKQERRRILLASGGASDWFQSNPWMHIGGS
jgi:hypothetical protein